MKACRAGLNVPPINPRSERSHGRSEIRCNNRSAIHLWGSFKMTETLHRQENACTSISAHWTFLLSLYTFHIYFVSFHEGNCDRQWKNHRWRLASAFKQKWIGHAQRYICGCNTNIEQSCNENQLTEQKCRFSFFSKAQQSLSEIYEHSEYMQHVPITWDSRQDHCRRYERRRCNNLYFTKSAKSTTCKRI